MGFQGTSRTEITGYVAKDPELRHTANNTAVATFSIPVTRKWGEQEKTEWFRCVAWGKVADIVSKYVHKGSLLQVDGYQQTKEWEDKEGVKRYSTEIIINYPTLLPGGGGKKKKDEVAGGKASDDEDLPF
ncbi:MAG: single-stranded DNA-binding protein [Dehalococcoidia bacterium]|nr:MAG: single-stranded DNA-binding protein [Dehalococcoidia bacterium]